MAAFDPASESIRFVPAIQSTRRPLLPDEAFYSIKSQSADIRVTSNHRMLYDHKKRTGWKFKTAEELSKLRDTSYLPCAGYTRSRGVPLTDDELRFIGWVMTDGTINKATGGICITQGAHQPWLEEIEKCIIGCGFKFTRGVRKRVSQFKSNSDCVFWTISKGKPRGTDLHLRGWGAIYEYLSKDFSEKLMEVSSRQFDVLIQAIHLGDGAKQGGGNGRGDPSIFQPAIKCSRTGCKLPPFSMGIAAMWLSCTTTKTQFTAFISRNRIGCVSEETERIGRLGARIKI